MASSALFLTPSEAAIRLQSEPRILVATHEAPDGDAVGCISAFLQIVNLLGIPCEAYIPGTIPIPDEYLFLPCLEDIHRDTPPLLTSDSSVYLFDCASLERANFQGMQSGVVRVNIDHHQDNAAYGEYNLLDPLAASSTVLLYRMVKAGNLPMSRDIATALYVGLATDTGQFQFSNTNPEAHRVAAELQEVGVNVSEVYRRVFEQVDLPKFMLLQRALSNLQLRMNGALAISWLNPEDYALAGAKPSHAEGIIDNLRRIKGVKVAALVKDRSDRQPMDCKVSLRATDDSVNVAKIANKYGGGGHIRAAGFTCIGTVDMLMNWVEDEVRVAL